MSEPNDRQFFKRKFRTAHDWKTYLRAVIRATDAMKAEGMEPGSDSLTANHALLLKHVKPRILAFWCEDTALEPEQFPFTDNDLAETWMDWRKSLPDVIRRTRADCGLDEGGLFDQ